MMWLVWTRRLTHSSDVIPSLRMSIGANIDIVPPFQDYDYVPNGSRVPRAAWFTRALVGGGILSPEFMNAQVAPAVIGIAKPVGETDEATRVCMAVNGDLEDVSTHYLPSNKSGSGGWSPHHHLKGHVRRVLEDATKDIKKGPRARLPFETAIYSGFIFPNVGRGALLLDSIQASIECTPSSVRKVADRASEEYGLGTIYVGSTAVVGGNDVPRIYFSVPSVARLAMDRDGLRGGGDLSARFSDAAAQLMELGG